MATFQEEREALTQRIHRDADLARLRIEILAFLERYVAARSDSIGCWDKAHLIDAINALSRHVRHATQPSKLLLRYCLARVRNASIPDSGRREPPSADCTPLDALTMQDLLEHMSELRNEIVRRA